MLSCRWSLDQFFSCRSIWHPCSFGDDGRPYKMPYWCYADLRLDKAGDKPIKRLIQVFAILKKGILMVSIIDLAWNVLTQRHWGNEHFLTFIVYILQTHVHLLMFNHVLHIHLHQVEQNDIYSSQSERSRSDSIALEPSERLWFLLFFLWVSSSDGLRSLFVLYQSDILWWW